MVVSLPSSVVTAMQSPMSVPYAMHGQRELMTKEDGTDENTSSLNSYRPHLERISGDGIYGAVDECACHSRRTGTRRNKA